MRGKGTVSRKDATRQAPATGRSPPTPARADEGTLARREADVVAQEQAVLGREVAADLREQATDLGERSLRARNKTARTRAAMDALSQAQMLEVNELLVVATVHAQTMTEAAEQATAQMTQAAEHDFLTGLPNRALLTDRLELSIALAKRHGKKVALMYLDLDHFKHINDSLGHAAGDQVLQSVARRLQACVRTSDTVSRQGGDEFVVLLAEVEDVGGATNTAQKLIEAMTEPLLVGNHLLHITFSIGISLYPDDGKDIETVVRSADTAMYYAKKGGRNTYKVFTPDMKVRAAARLSIEQALHRALEQRKFEVHYQPKVNLETGAIIGVEALLRWRRSEHRLVLPGQFLAVAEGCGLILPIGRWVQREACRQMQAWLRDGLDPGGIAVNVSAAEFQGKEFVSHVGGLLKDTGLEPHRLQLETTEAVLMQDAQYTMNTLRALKGLGVQVAVDDFGTGCSSLSLLRSLPIDELKIDMSFVQAIGNEADEAIVRAIIAIGHGFKLRVMAEGIETRKQRGFLRSNRCSEGHGYHFGRPVAAGEFTKLLAAHRQ